MIWLAKIYKAWSVNLDSQNKVAIEVPELVQQTQAAVYEFEEAETDFEGNPDIDVEAQALAFAENTREKAQEQAKSIVDGANLQADAILVTARLEAEAMRKRAKEEIEQERTLALMDAKKSGYDEGYNEGEAAAKGLVDEAKRLKAETEAQREAAIKRLEPELVELIIRIVRKLVSDTMKLKPQVVMHLIRQGLAQSNFTGDITLRVSKEDYDNVVSNKDELLKLMERGADLIVTKDFSLNQGDCVIETPFGVIDSSLEMQFEEIRESLSLILEGEPAV